jgi:hypothetical protein
MTFAGLLSVRQANVFDAATVEAIVNALKDLCFAAEPDSKAAPQELAACLMKMAGPLFRLSGAAEGWINDRGILDRLLESSQYQIRTVEMLGDFVESVPGVLNVSRHVHAIRTPSLVTPARCLLRRGH